MKNGARIAGTLLLGAVLGTGLALTACGGSGGGGTSPAATTAATTGSATAGPTGARRPSASPGAGYKDDYGY